MINKELSIRESSKFVSTSNYVLQSYNFCSFLLFIFQDLCAII